MSVEENRPRPSLNRRSFMRGTAAALAFPSLAAFLEACSKSPGGSAGASALPTFSVASPTNPVKWDIPATNKAIASGLTPEQGGVVNIYTYTDYIDPEALKSFEAKYKKYNVKALVTTFEDTTEAITKIRSGGVNVDLYNPSYDQLGKLIKTELIQPLNHDYIPNIANVWPEFTNPFYDQEWRYTTPYTVYTTGIAWRADKVTADIAAMPNPYDSLWDPTYSKKLSVLDDYRTCMGMVAFRNNLSPNTTNPDDLKLIHKQLTQLNQTMMPKVNVTDYQDLPTGVVDICQAWSGDAINMQSYMPKGQSADVLRYWFPSDGKGAIDNDLLVITKTCKSPVLAHLFLDHMLDYDVAIGNFGAIGYQPPQVKITPDKLVSDQFIPQNLAAAVVLPAYFDAGQRSLELSPADDSAWQLIWQQFKAGA